MTIKNHLAPVFLFAVLSCWGQTTELIIKDNTGSPIPFVHIVNNCGFGAITNEEGVALVDHTALIAGCSTFETSHLSYIQRAITLSPNEPTVHLALEDKSIVLEEIQVGPSEVANFIDLVYQKAQKQYPGSLQNSKGYYKQLTKNDGKIVELLEMLPNFEYSNKGVEHWEVKNARYAKDSTGICTFTNYSTYSKGFYGNFGTWGKMTSPISDHSKNYEFQNAGTYQDGVRKISFQLKKPIKKMIAPTTGFVLISEKDSSILKIHGKLQSLVGIKKSYFPFKVKNHEANYELVYNNGEFHYSQIETRFDLSSLFKKKHSVRVKSLFLNLGNTEGQTITVQHSKNERRSDLDIAKSAPYDSDLWRHPRIKRLSEEEASIDFFERNDFFVHE